MARSGQGSAWPDFVGGFAFGFGHLLRVLQNPEEFPSSPRVPHRLAPIRNSFVDRAGRIRIISCVHRICSHADLEFFRPIRSTESPAPGDPPTVPVSGCLGVRTCVRVDSFRGSSGPHARPRSTEQYFTAGGRACNRFLKLCTSGEEVVANDFAALEFSPNNTASLRMWINGE